MTNIERLKKAKPIIEKTLLSLKTQGLVSDEESFWAGVVTTITALFAKEVQRGLFPIAD